MDATWQIRNKIARCSTIANLGSGTVDNTFDISALLIIRSAAARLSSSVQSDAIIRESNADFEKPVSSHTLMRGPASQNT